MGAFIRTNTTVTLCVGAVLLLCMRVGAGTQTLTFDDLIQGETAYNFDGNKDGKADITFLTKDPYGFNTVGPGNNMTYIQEPGLEGTSLLPEDLRVNFLTGATRNVSFGFALDSYSQDDTTAFRVYDAKGKLLASKVETGLYTTTPLGQSSFPEGRISVDFAGTATHATFDFTSDIGRYIVDNFMANSPNVYGLFVGPTNDWHHGELNAQALSDTISKDLPNFKEGIVLKGDVAQGGITNSQVKQAIDTLAAKMSPGDQFILYDNSHGGTSDVGIETTLTKGNEWMVLGQDLSDDSLATYLKDLPNNVSKWVFVDTCQAGGFWGDNNSQDIGDLEKLSGIALFAASAEDKVSYANSDGRGLFGLSLIDAFSLDANGFLRADSDHTDGLTFSELTSWVQAEPGMTGTFVREQGFGDSSLFTPDMWAPESWASPDFGGSLFGGQLPPVGPASTIPAPGALLLGGIGMGLVGWLRKRGTV